MSNVVRKKTQLGNVIELKYWFALPQRDRVLGKNPVYWSWWIVDYHNEFFVQWPGIVVWRKWTIWSIYYSNQNFCPIDTVFYIEQSKDAYNLKFIYYLLQTLKLNKLNSDAAVPWLNRNTAYLQDIYIPSDIPTQQRISSILSTYDDLIENNARRIKILEEQAQLIYKERFVKFKFPGCEKVKMMDSGTELGEVPEWWEVKSLGDCVKVSRWQNITKDTVENWKIPVIAWGLMPSCYHSKSNTKWPVITISASWANAGYVNLHYQDVRASDSSYIDKNITPFVYYYYLLFKERQFEISWLQRWAAIPHVYATDLMWLLIIKSSGDIIEKFMKIINPIFENMWNLQKQNQNLKETRDMLIPKLVSGEVEV